jgi:hypothetical protein
MKTFKELREGKSKGSRNTRQVMTKKQGLPTWAKGAAVGLLAKLMSAKSSVNPNNDSGIRDERLADMIALSASMNLLGMAVNTQDKSLASKAKSFSKGK